VAFAPFMRWNFEADRWKNVLYHVGDARVPKRGMYGRDRSNLRDIRFELKDDGKLEHQARARMQSRRSQDRKKNIRYH